MPPSLCCSISYSLITSVILSAVMGTLMMLILNACASYFIWVSNALQILFSGAFALIAFAVGDVATALFLGLLCTINVVWLWCVWQRIPFASVMLQAACEVAYSNIATVFVTYFGVALQVRTLLCCVTLNQTRPSVPLRTHTMPWVCGMPAINVPRQHLAATSTNCLVRARDG